MRTGLIFVIILFIYFLSGCERPVDNNQTGIGIPPAVPTGLKVYYANDGEVFIYWHHNNESDLKGYNIYRSTDSTHYSKEGFTSENYFYDDSLSYDSTYMYKVTALNLWNDESLPTVPVSATPLNLYAPEAPRNLLINARNWQGKLSVYLMWDPAKESDVKDYKIYRDTVADFNPDSSKFIGLSGTNNFSDTTRLALYKIYYYRTKAVDQGGLISKESPEVSDQILSIPQIIFPQNNSQTNYFQYFKIHAIKIPATYKIIVQDNEFFGTFWQTEFSSENANDTLLISFDATYIQPNTTYYWRIAAYSHQSTEPNSVSPLYKFVIKQ